VGRTPHRLAGARLQAGIGWWDELTGAGGERMVAKPLDVIHLGPKGPAPHGIKVRGRALGHKRSLAQREFALGLEALDRFVAGEPLYRVHEYVFGILALESEPIDPRL
jgi:protein phosphatase